MRNRILYCSILIIFGVNTTTNAQRLHELTPYSFYQEWHLVSKDYRKNLLTYSTVGKLSSAKSNSSNSILKFKRRSHVLYSKKLKPIQKKRAPIKKKIPPNWSNAPKKMFVVHNRCGTRINTKKNSSGDYKLIPRYSKKGIWKVYSKNDLSFLVLKHFVSINNKGYTLEKEEEFQIVSLEEDKMVLQKITEESIH